MKTKLMRPLDIYLFLSVLFACLKVLHLVSFSWLWVLSPLWIPTCLTLALIAIVLLCGLLAAGCELVILALEWIRR